MTNTAIKVLDLQKLLIRIPHEQYFTSPWYSVHISQLKGLEFSFFPTKIERLYNITRMLLVQALTQCTSLSAHQSMRDNDQTSVSQHISKEKVWLLMCCNLSQGPLVPREGELGGLVGGGGVPYFGRSGRTLIFFAKMEYFRRSEKSFICLER